MKNKNFIFLLFSIMGLLGGQLGRVAGGGLGQAIGQKFGGNLGGQVGRDLGNIAGGALGALLPFKNGGKVYKTGAALLHKNEVVLPAGVKPTAAQKKAIRMRGGVI